MAKHVPALNKKFRFLIERGYVDSLEAIAQHFGKSITTIQWWEHGDQTRAPNSISDPSEGALFDLIASCLPEPQSEVSVRRLTYAPFDEFERVFDVLSETTLDDLIAAEGRVDGIRIIEKDTADLFEFDDDAARTPRQIPANQYFRLELDLAFQGARATALRLQDNTWTPLPTALDHDAAVVLVPGLLPDGRYRFMRETEPDRAMRIVVLQTASLLPEAIAIALRQRVALDPGSLSSLVVAFEREPRLRRALHAIDLKTVAP